MIVNAAFAIGGILLALFMRIALQRANKKLDAGAGVDAVMQGASQADIPGLTEDERRGRRDAFRYIT